MNIKRMRDPYRGTDHPEWPAQNADLAPPRVVAGTVTLIYDDGSTIYHGFVERDSNGVVLVLENVRDRL